MCKIAINLAKLCLLFSYQVVNGLVPDGKALSLRGREESEQYTKMFKIRIPVAILAERIALRAQMSTIYASYRPFGTSLVVGGWDNLRKDFSLYMIEPSGQCFEYYGCASGKGKQIARNEIEKKNFREMTVEEALPLVVKILLTAQEENKDKR